jgi:hypothetical protein
MVPKFERLYARKHAPTAYRNEVRAMVRVLQDRYGLSKRETPPAGVHRDTDSMAAEPEQAAFAW